MEITGPANYENQEQQPRDDIARSPASPAIVFPPKPDLAEKKQDVWVKSLMSLALYLAFGFFVFQDKLALLLIITGIVIFHELGHFLAMKIFDYKELGIFFIPLLGAYASGTKHEVSQKQSIIILLAGPLPGIILGIIFHFITLYSPNELLETTSRLLILLNLFNLLPVYPLDGGQILNRLFMDENHFISRTFIILSAAAMIWFSWEYIYPYSQLAFFILLYFPLNIILRLIGEIKNERLIKKIEAEGVNLSTAYEDITDENYWHIRNALIKHHPDLKDIPPAPPYQYASREDKVIVTMQALLQRYIIMDVTLAGKLIIIAIWAGSFLTPLLFKISMILF